MHRSEMNDRDEKRKLFCIVVASELDHKKKILQGGQSIYE